MLLRRLAANKLPMTTPLLKPITASTIIFDGKNEKFELFEDLFHTMLKMQPEMTEAMKNKPFSLALTERSSTNLQKYPKYESNYIRRDPGHF